MPLFKKAVVGYRDEAPAPTRRGPLRGFVGANPDIQAEGFGLLELHPSTVSETLSGKSSAGVSFLRAKRIRFLPTFQPVAICRQRLTPHLDPAPSRGAGRTHPAQYLETLQTALQRADDLAGPVHQPADKNRCRRIYDDRGANQQG
jgi:hypothetical protein